MTPSDIVTLVNKWLEYLELTMLRFEHDAGRFEQLAAERRKFVQLRRDAEAAAGRGRAHG